jgi:mevalonate kinase
LRTGEYCSKGKFLISGEYFVLHGAKGLAVPLRFSQRMIVTEIHDPGVLLWETIVLGQPWLSARYHMDDISVLETTDAVKAGFIRNLLTKAAELQPALHRISTGYSVRNIIDFDMNWGLGSSSSLVSNISYWLDIDPFELYKKAFQGSGYDVYCARAEKPIIYWLSDGNPVIREVDFKPSFSGHLFFVYSGRKQDSQESVRDFRELSLNNKHVIDKISSLTDSLISAESLEEFSGLLRQHEKIVSDATGMPVVKESYFPDFDGEIKSLGAWGGDFILAATPMKYEETRDYFAGKGLAVVFRWEEIVFNN